MNYDHPDSLETDLLIEHLKELKAGRSIDSPVYDYSQHNRSHETVRIDPKPILDGWKLLEATAIYRADGSLFVSYAAAGQPQALSPPSARCSIVAAASVSPV